MLRIGHGYDVHRLVDHRDLWLGGVQIPYPKGLQGHSDGDVLIHAMMDAIVGALALGDIGRHFPDTDQDLKGIDSKVLLDRLLSLEIVADTRIINMDATIIAEKPKLKDHIPKMVDLLANRMGIDPSQLNIKATTEEGLGFTGKKEGIAAHAVVLLDQASQEDPSQRVAKD